MAAIVNSIGKIKRNMCTGHYIRTAHEIELRLLWDGNKFAGRFKISVRALTWALMTTTYLLQAAKLPLRLMALDR